MSMLHKSFHAMIGIATGLGIIAGATAALAADKVVLKYGPLRESLSVAELSTFAKTGEASPSLNSFMRMTKAEPEGIRQTLTREVRINHVLLDRILNSPVGDLALDEMGKAIHTPSNSANRQALRSALVLSASGDGKLSLMETIQNYPTSEVQVEGERLESAYNQLDRVSRQIRGILGFLQLF